MSLHPQTAGHVTQWPPPKPPKRLTPFKFENAMMHCGREAEDVHICRVTNNETLMSLWWWLRDGLLRIKHKSPSRIHWTPEHVRLAIQRGFLGQETVECFVAHDGADESLHGFLISHAFIDPFVQVAFEQYIWFMNIEFDLLERLMPEWNAMCLKRGYLGWRWGTTRRGWERRAARFGAKVVDRVLALTLVDY